MSEGINTVSEAPTDGHAIGFWSQFRRTLGPWLVGLCGGGLTVGVVCSGLLPLMKNSSKTYAEFPSLQPPRLANDVSLSAAILATLQMIGGLAPFGMGLATAWLVRAKDRWEEISAGLSTAFAGSLAAYVVGIGWAVSVTTVVVPLIRHMYFDGLAA